MIEKLKAVDLNKLSLEEVAEHKKNVLTLSESEIIEYLTFAIDNYYKTEEEGDNSEIINNFFDIETFKSYYDTIINTLD